MKLIKKKQNIRKWAYIERNLVHSKIAKQASEKVAGFLEDFFVNDQRSSGIQFVGAYFSVKSELELFPTVERLRVIGKVISLPVVVDLDKPLVFYRWDKNSELVKGKFNIPAPAGGDIIYPDILLCPLLSFDNEGNRLGYGGGFYDRTIEELNRVGKNILRIGCGYSTQFSTKILPTDKNDKKLDAIVTENGLVFF